MPSQQVDENLYQSRDYTSDFTFVYFGMDACVTRLSNMAHRPSRALLTSLNTYITGYRSVLLAIVLKRLWRTREKFYLKWEFFSFSIFFPIFFTHHSRIIQLLVAIWGSWGYFSMGAVRGWSSPGIPSLNRTLDFEMSQSDFQWICIWTINTETRRYWLTWFLY